MSELLALSVSVALLGGIWAFIALGPLASYTLVWVGFIAAGCFFAAGGDTKALTKTIVGMVYGAVIAWIALLCRGCQRYRQAAPSPRAKASLRR
jgi:ABC-type Co2+ transport system permease subunit